MTWLNRVWNKQFSAEPWAVEQVGEHGVLTVTEFNHAYAESCRARLPEDVRANLTDAEAVKMWVDRRNHELEEPKLEIIHSEISPEGKIKMKLEWNDAFIRQLQNRGFQGDTEDDLIQAYLHQITRATDDKMFNEETSDIPLAPPVEEDDIEAILDSTPPETLKQIEKSIRRRAAQRGARQRNMDK